MPLPVEEEKGGDRKEAASEGKRTVAFNGTQDVALANLYNTHVAQASGYHSCSSYSYGNIVEYMI